MIPTPIRTPWLTSLLLALPAAAQHGAEAARVRVAEPALQALARAVDAAAQHGAEAARVKVAEPAAHNLALGIDKSQVKLRMPAQDLARYDFVIPQAAGKAVDIRSRVHTEGTSSTLDVPLKELVFIRPKSIETLDPAQGKVYSSGRMLWSTEGAARGEVSTSSYRTLFDFENAKLTWSKADGAYSTRLFISIEPEDPKSTKVPDKLSVVFTFSIDGADVKVDPNPVTVTRIGTPMPVKLVCARHDATPKVTAKSNYGDHDASFIIVPSLLLDVTTSTDEILGLGLETETLHVQRMAEDRKPWSDGSPLTVTFHANRGEFDPKSVVLEPNQTTSAPVVFRSSGVRDVSVSAEASGVTSAAKTIRLTWPIGIFACALVAGAVGGLIRDYEQKRGKRSRAARLKGPPPWLVASLIGAVVGVALVFAVALGIQSFPTASLAYTEAGAALIGLLAGYTGTRLLGSLAETVFGGKAAAA